METRLEIQDNELKVLILEDSIHDLELIREQLSDAGYKLDVTHVENEVKFTASLIENSYDIILSDFQLPGFNAFRSLQISNEICPEIPFICISGSIGEETAIELLKLGAVDYVLKDKPERLPFAIKRALEEAIEKVAYQKAVIDLQKSESRFQQVAENAQEWIWEVDSNGLYTYTSPVIQSLLGYSVEEVVEKKHLYDFLTPERKDELMQVILGIFSKKESFKDFEYPNIHKDGHILILSTSGSPIFDEEGNFKGYRGVVADITKRKQIEAEFIASELNFRRSISESPLGIRIVSVEGKTIYANKAFLDIYEFNDLEEFTSTPAINRYTPESYVQHQERKKKRDDGDEVFDYEISIICKNNQLRHIKVSRKELLWNGSKHFQVINLDITEQRNAEEQLRKFASHLQNVREEEKISLAREIHDDLGQILVALKIDMGLLKKDAIKKNTFRGSEDTLDKFDNIITLIDKTIITARRIMNGLRPELLEINGFVGASTSYLREFQDRHQITCEFISEISEIEMNSQQSLAFFRILQEALNNIAKHSKATLVKVYFRDESNKLSLEIIDNGIGFDKNYIGRQDSYGMIGMKERVVLLEGELNISSEMGHGTCVRVEIPYLNK